MACVRLNDRPDLADRGGQTPLERGDIFALHRTSPTAGCSRSRVRRAVPCRAAPCWAGLGWAARCCPRVVAQPGKPCSGEQPLARPLFGTRLRSAPNVQTECCRSGDGRRAFPFRALRARGWYSGGTREYLAEGANLPPVERSDHVRQVDVLAPLELCASELSVGSGSRPPSEGVLPSMDCVSTPKYGLSEYSQVWTAAGQCGGRTIGPRCCVCVCVCVRAVHSGDGLSARRPNRLRTTGIQSHPPLACHCCMRRPAMELRRVLEASAHYM